MPSKCSAPLPRIDPASASASVITLLEGGALEGKLVEQGIDVQSLGLSRRFPRPDAVVQLAKHLVRRKPDLVVTWLYYSNLIGGVAARMVGGIPVVWNVRHSTLQAPLARCSIRWVNWWAARLSRRVPTRTVFVAHAAQQSHSLSGYDTDRASVIVNGFDPVLFRPDPAGPDRAPRAGLVGHDAAGRTVWPVSRRQGA